MIFYYFYISNVLEVIYTMSVRTCNCSLYNVEFVVSIFWSSPQQCQSQSSSFGVCLSARQMENNDNSFTEAVAGRESWSYFCDTETHSLLWFLFIYFWSGSRLTALGLISLCQSLLRVCFTSLQKWLTDS